MKAQLAKQISTQTQTQTQAQAQTSGSAAELNLPPMIRELHAKALAAAARFKSAEIELLQVLEEVGLHRAFLR
ncbi:MAG: hypothetical protein IT288_16450, partial [Bdellovibrionales bacterium]|nr:hypothetical protein [Bdellovibrionales bacterium]